MSKKILDNVRLIQKCFIINAEKKILALRRNADDHSRGGNWDLPGGGYEEGEDVIDAIKREVREEANLEVLTVIPVYFTNRLNVGEGFFQGNTVFATCYYSSDWRGEVVLSSEHTEYKWVTPEEFKSLNFGADSGFFSEAIGAYTSLLS